MMLLDYFGVFGWIYGKMDEISKIWAISGVLRRGVGIPRSSIGPRQGVACPRGDVAEREVWTASGTPQHSSATQRRNYCSQHGNFRVLFCFAIPLFRGLVYWTNEDPISV